MTIASLESLSFGLVRTVEAAVARGHRLVLLTGYREVYLHELAHLPDHVAEALDVIDVDTHDIDAVRRVLRSLPDLAGLINTTDTWSLPAAELAAELGLPGPAPDSVRVLRDKALVREALRGASVAGQRAQVLDPGRPGAPAEGAAALVRETVGLPAVLKDSAGTSSRSVWIVHDDEELDAALAEAAGAPFAGRLIAEPFLAGPLYSAETLSWDGGTRLFGVASRVTSRVPAVREEASALPVALPPGGHEEIERWAGRVLAATGHDQGFAHIEFVLTRSGPELVEVNRRIGGALVGEALCRILGANVYEALIDVTLGRRPALLDEHPAGPGAGAGTGAGIGPAAAAGSAVAFVAVYPEQPGVLTGFAGLEGLAAFPGDPEWYAVRSPGDAVPHIGDQRGCVGMILAEGATAELAQHRAWSAATTVRARMKPEPEPESEPETETVGAKGTGGP